MKVLLFTHKSDIDGMGNAVLAKLSFDDVDYAKHSIFKMKFQSFMMMVVFTIMI